MVRLAAGEGCQLTGVRQSAARRGGHAWRAGTTTNAVQPPCGTRPGWTAAGARWSHVNTTRVEWFADGPHGAPPVSRRCSTPSECHRRELAPPEGTVKWHHMKTPV